MEVNPVYQLQSVQEQMNRAAKRAGELYAEGLDASFGVVAMKNPVESPLEAVFLIWWEALRGVHMWDSTVLATQQTVMVNGRTRRLDFAIRPSDAQLIHRSERVGLAYPLIAVEVDGHDYHERTRKQVADRNERDRHLQAMGWTVFHFSGSEIYRDPESCVFEVMNFAETKHVEFARALFYAERGETPPD